MLLPGQAQQSMFYNPFRMDVATFGPPVLKAIKKSIESSLSILEKISPVDDTLKTLIADYKKLHEIVTSDIDNISKYNITTFPTRVNDINSKEEALDARRVTYLQPITGPKVVTIYTILADIWTDMKNNIIGITTIFGMIFGAIVASHWAITSGMDIDMNIFYQTFYTFFGALLFPIPILYGVINPPMWRAPLVPIFKRTDSSPAWINYPGINLFTYIAPRPDDLPMGKMVLRIMCMIITGFIGTSFYLKINPK